MQQAAEAAVAEGLKRRARRERAARAKGTPRCRTSRCRRRSSRMDPATGHVRAMVGGRDFDESPFNRAVQAHRQPGSAFKPFVYAAALEAGFTPATMIENLDEPIDTLEGAWTPEDEHSTADCDEPARRAAHLEQSRRGPPAAGGRHPEDRATTRKTMGVGDVPSVPSLALGSGEVTLQSMTAAYAAFANHGRGAASRSLIRRVEDRDGRVLFAAEESSTARDQRRRPRS